ncbi:hypothetical protein FS837_000999 [Tulasnella sp. UAMH 9824]|nr:hypothetical protein FS837_000999 [Tulasnella sp. UAMH 9824]
MKASSLSAVVLVSLAGAGFARPSPQASGVPIPACVQTCINQVVGTGTCTDATDVQCLCGSDVLKSCVQSGCPPSFVDSLGQYCGTGEAPQFTLQHPSESASSQPFTIQTNTLSGATETPAATTSAASSVVAATTTSSPRASPSASAAAATSASPAGNTGGLTVTRPGLKEILGMGLAFAAGALLV